MRFASVRESMTAIARNKSIDSRWNGKIGQTPMQMKIG